MNLNVKLESSQLEINSPHIINLPRAQLMVTHYLIMYNVLLVLLYIGPHLDLKRYSGCSLYSIIHSTFAAHAQIIPYVLHLIHVNKLISHVETENARRVKLVSCFSFVCRFPAVCTALVCVLRYSDVYCI